MKEKQQLRAQSATSPAHACTALVYGASSLHQCRAIAAARLRWRQIVYNPANAMFSQKLLDEIAAAVNHVLPQPLAADARSNMRAALQSVLDRLDLVTREELEVQEALLARTRQKLQELEKKIAILEQRLPTE